MPSSQWQRETVERIGPIPTDDPVDRLRHVVRVYEGSSADGQVITATLNAYGDGVWTGLTWGDLRAILDRCDES